MRIVTFLIIAPYKHSYLLTYLLTYLHARLDNMFNRQLKEVSYCIHPCSVVTSNEQTTIRMQNYHFQLHVITDLLLRKSTKEHFVLTALRVTVTNK